MIEMFVQYMQESMQKGGLPAFRCYSLTLVDTYVFVQLSFLFSLFCSVSDGKSFFSVKKIISTSKWHVEHPYAGGNTQQKLKVKMLLEFTLLAQVDGFHHRGKVDLWPLRGSYF